MLDANKAQDVFSTFIRLNDFISTINKSIADRKMSKEEGNELIMMTARHIYILTM